MTPLPDNSKKLIGLQRRSWKLFSWRKKSTLYASKASMIFCPQTFPPDNSKKRAALPTSSKTVCTYRRMAPLSTPDNGKGADSRG
jgi:hypothetical protein